MTEHRRFSRDLKSFREKIRSVNFRVYFKAIELKVFLLYLAPIVLNILKESEFSQSNKQDLFHLVFALKFLYETNADADLCYDLLENLYKFERKKSPEIFRVNQFHLLRHLAWQAKTFGPLWVTSAMAFESANHHLIRPVTGTLNTCKLLAQRYIRNKELENAIVENDCLKLLLLKNGKQYTDDWQNMV